MFCNKCGNQVFPNQKYCNKCGNYLAYNVKKVEDTNLSENKSIESSKKKTVILIIILILVIVITLIILVYAIYLLKIGSGYFFTGGNQTEKNKVINLRGKYKTSIVTDNTYDNLDIDSVQEANDLIVQDSINQKQEDYPKEILDVENDIIDKYSITAVNLNPEFAKELENVIDKIYKDYPNVRGYLSNITLKNYSLLEGSVIASFRPVFRFGTSDTISSTPWVTKTLIELNSKYFLNEQKLVEGVKEGAKAGHFPKNTTKYSPVAHELGHYLSFIALLNYYDVDSIRLMYDINELEEVLEDFSEGDLSLKMIKEAYDNYKRDTNDNIKFDKWRGQISGYALSKDDSGKYIYDETIAEAFHDVYLNNENATTPSKYIVEVLKRYVGG